MIIQVFRPLESDSDTLQQNKLADISTANSFTYTKRFCDVGDFTLEVQGGTRFDETLQPGNLLFVDYQYWVIIEDVVRTLNSRGYDINIKGVDLNGILLQRITLYGETQGTGTQGYDVIQGNTETVVKHYIENNITKPVDEARRIPGFAIAPNLGRGIQEDTYMSRFEDLSELTKKVCKNADLGYEFKVDLTNSQFVFDVVEPLDLTESQRENNRVVFAVDRGNVATMTRNLGISSMKNAFYATKSGGTLEADALTQLVYRENDPEPTGIHRREMQLNVTISEEAAGQEIEDMIAAARKEAVNHKPTDSLDCDIEGLYKLGVDYRLGDYVSTTHPYLGSVDQQITEAVISYNANGRTLKLAFGEKAPKILNALNNKITNKGV